MKKFLTVLATAFAVFALMANGASAAKSTSDAFESMDSGYIRIYASGSAGSDATAASDEPTQAMAGVYTFKDKDTIDGHLEDFVKGFSDEFFDGETTVKKMNKLGDDAYKVSGEFMVSGEKTPASAVFVQQDEVVYMAITMGNEGTDVAEDMAKFMIDKGIGDDEVDFQDDGTSTGGPFDAMPTSDDVDGLANLQPMMDMNMLDAATPSA